MNTLKLWEEISVSALLGTQRKPFRAPVGDGALGRLLSAARAQTGEDNDSETTDEGERTLLAAIAITSVHRKAGQLPPRGPLPAVSACPIDTRPRCSKPAGACLERILRGGMTSMLPEWLALADGLKLRAREEHLPLLLDYSKNASENRAVLLAVLGSRGQWLAAQNPDWRAFTGQSDERIWHEGQRRERLAFLTDLRQRDPQRARELLAGTWSQESPGERLVFLPVLSAKLSMADEPFLESILEDTRKDVRQSAALLLASLPQSRLVKRMTERLKRLLAWKSGLLRSTIEVTLPETCDEAMQRDAVDPRVPNGSRFGEKAWWLAQMLAVVPPSTWSAAWGKRPAAILEAIRKHEWEAALLHGWTESAVRAQDPEWLEALMSHESHRNDGKGVMALYPRIQAALKEKIMFELLRGSPSLSYDAPASVCLSSCRHPWSIELTQAVSNAIGLALQKGDIQPWRWEKLMREIPPYFNPDGLRGAINRIAAVLDKKDSGDPHVKNLLAALEFRLEMRQAFQLQEPE